MINKKLAILGMAGMMTTTLGTGVFAQEIQAKYDNTLVIVDPENPINPEWEVAIPSGVVFTDDNKEVDTTVELRAKGAGTLDGVEVNVAVASKNNYKLQLAGGVDPVDYQLSYGDTAMSDKVTTVAKLSKTAAVKVGKAVMTGTATKTGEHTDTLTYTVAKVKA